MFTTGIY